MTILFPGMVAGVSPRLIATGPWRLPLPVGPARWLGVVPLAGGLAILGLTIVDFAAVGRGTLAPWDAPRHLVRQRLYALVRNPMYLGVLSCILGQAVLWASGGVAAYLGLVALAFHLRVVFSEEPVLRRMFGQAFDEYVATVPRWIPRPPSRRGMSNQGGR
jgi:protein-S-isoprenylcysteine O-methyltransferase Ste14